MIDPQIKEIFKKGSRTYFNSSIFFPASVRKDVFYLYAFVRTADNFVDQLPQKKEKFYFFCERYRQGQDRGESPDPVIGPFIQLMTRCQFDPRWVDAFLHSMKLDLNKNSYQTLEDVEEYIHGSAEVIGLMMAQIMGLDPGSHAYASRLGKAMQYINFIRDIPEDLELGRTYFPADDMAEFGLSGLSNTAVKEKPERFINFIQKQIQRYESWQKQAEAGFHYLPRWYRIPVQTASDMYHWTAQQIKKDPLKVFQTKIKPRRCRIIFRIFYNSLFIPWRRSHCPAT
jgi:phytoene synthase